MKFIHKVFRHTTIILMNYGTMDIKSWRTKKSLHYALALQLFI